MAFRTWNREGNAIRQLSVGVQHCIRPDRELWPQLPEYLELRMRTLAQPRTLDHGLMEGQGSCLGKSRQCQMESTSILMLNHSESA